MVMKSQGKGVPTMTPQHEANHDSPVVEGLAALLGEGTRAGAWSVPNPRLTAVMLFHALHGALHEGNDAAKDVNRTRLSRELGGFFRRAVALVRR